MAGGPSNEQKISQESSDISKTVNRLAGEISETVNRLAGENSGPAGRYLVFRRSAILDSIKTVSGLGIGKEIQSYVPTMRVAHQSPRLDQRALIAAGLLPDLLVEPGAEVAVDVILAGKLAELQPPGQRAANCVLEPAEDTMSDGDYSTLLKARKKTGEQVEFGDITAAAVRKYVAPTSAVLGQSRGPRGADGFF